MSSSIYALLLHSVQSEIRRLGYTGTLRDYECS